MSNIVEEEHLNITRYSTHTHTHTHHTSYELQIA